MKLPKLSATQSLDSPVEWFRGKSSVAQPFSTAIVGDVMCLLSGGINLLDCITCVVKALDCFKE